MVRVEVRDEDTSSPPRQHPDQATEIRFRLVSALSEAWGVEQIDARGKCTGFEMRS